MKVVSTCTLTVCLIALAGCGSGGDTLSPHDDALVEIEGSDDGIHHFVSLTREIWAMADASVFDSPAAVVAHADTIVVGRISAVSPGRQVFSDRSESEPLYTTAFLDVTVDQQLKPANSGSSPAAMRVEVLLPHLASADTYARALPSSSRVLMGLREAPANLGNFYSTQSEATTPGPLWNVLPQAFIVEGSHGEALEAAVPEDAVLSVPTEESPHLGSFDQAVELVIELVGEGTTHQTSPDPTSAVAPGGDALLPTTTVPPSTSVPATPPSSGAEPASTTTVR